MVRAVGDRGRGDRVRFGLLLRGARSADRAGARGGYTFKPIGDRRRYVAHDTA